MSILDGLRHRLHVLRSGDRYGAEVEREMRFHLELETLAQSSGGVAVDVETNARRLLGNATYYREEVRRMTVLQWGDRIRQDTGYAWRGLKRSPGFACTVIATLGLGLGMNAAMYSFLDRLFVRNPAGVAAPNGVRRLYINAPHSVAVRGSHVFGWFNYPLYASLRERIGSAIPIGAYTPSDSVPLTGASLAVSTRVSYVTPDYFGVLGVRPALGRFLAPDEGAIDARTPVVVIADALWRRAFAGDVRVLGRVVRINDQPYIIVGVAPPDFTGIDADLAELWVPLNCFPAETYDKRPWYVESGNYLRVIARVADPSVLARLTLAATTAIRAAAVGRPDTISTLLTGPIIEARGPAEEDQEISVSRRLAGVALIVLIIACANVANLLLLRSASRRRELAIRRALGVSRWRLYEQFLTESLMLAVLSGGAALLFALWGGGVIRKLLLPKVHWAAAPIDSRVILATVVATILIGLAAGLFPALGATTPDLAEALKPGARDRCYRASRTQGLLLVLQTSLSVVLLVGAGLLVRSLINVQSIDIGYDANGVIVATTSVSDGERQRSIGAGLTESLGRLRSMPGVTAAAAVSVAPMWGSGVTRVYLPGHDSVVKIAGDYPTYAAVSPEYFQTVGVRLLAGRSFDASDRATSALVVVVNEQMARGLWPREDPLGKCLVLIKPTNGCTRVVGVVANAHRSKIIERTGSQFYVPLGQPADPFGSGALLLRVDSRRMAAVSIAVRAELARLMPDASDYKVRSMTEILEPLLRPWRLGAILFSALGLLALVVATVGIYGVMAYATTQRTHEMGVRLALGAQMDDVMNLVLGDGLRLVLVGIAIGVAASLALGRLVTSLLFGVVANDASVLLLAVMTLSSFAAIACLIPGWRAARVDPITALRSD